MTWTINRGDTKTFDEIVTDTAGAPIPLTGATVTLAVADQIGTEQIDWLFTKVLTLPGPETHRARVSFVPADTALLAWGDYLGQIRIVFADASTYTLPWFVFSIEQGVWG